MHISILRKENDNMYNPLLMIDFYKAVHSEQYPRQENGSPLLKRIYSPYTPRMSRLADVDKVTYFGGQMFAKSYLIDAFNKYFFTRSEEEVVREYDRVLHYTLGPGTYKLPDLLLRPGNTLIKYSGSGQAVISYREAVL